MIHDLENRIDTLLNTEFEAGQQTKFLTETLELIIDLLRALAGDEFCIGFLQGALNNMHQDDKAM
jgi:hypothetical protein